MLIYLPFLVIVSASAVLSTDAVKRLAWNMSVLCDNFKAALAWYPELPPPRDTHEAKERVNRVTYGPVWEAMPPVKTGEERKRQHDESWWQWMSSSWGHNIPYAALGIRTGEEYAKNAAESWEAYEQRMLRIFSERKQRALLPPVAIPVLAQMTSTVPASPSAQDTRTVNPFDMMPEQAWQSVKAVLADAAAETNPEHSESSQGITINGLTVNDLSGEDIMKRDLENIAIFTALQMVAGEKPDARFNKDGHLVNSNSKAISERSPRQPQRQLENVQYKMCREFTREKGIGCINLMHEPSSNPPNWRVTSLLVSTGTKARMINVYVPSEHSGPSRHTMERLALDVLPMALRMTLNAALGVMAQVRMPRNRTIIVRNPSVREGTERDVREEAPVGQVTPAPDSGRQEEQRDSSIVLPSDGLGIHSIGHVPTHLVRASILGRVESILVSPGTVVTTDTNVLVMMVMKMQTTIASPVNGTVRNVLVRVGDDVGIDTVLLEIEPSA